MKKLFISITAGFVFLITCIIPFTASAHDYTSTGFIDSFFQNNSNYTRDDNNNYYLYFEIRDSDGDRWFKHFLIIPKDRLSITEDVNGNIILSDSANLGFGSPYTDGNQNQSYVWGSATNFTSITINFDLHKLVRTENSSGGVWYESRTIREFETTIPDFNVGSVEVEVFPELCENFDYTVEYEGSQLPINCIQVDVINNTGYNYQYAVIIQPKNASLSYGLPPNTNNYTMFWGNSGITYALIKDEWIQYQMDIVIDQIVGSTNMGLSPVVNTNTPSAWHFVSHHDTAREQIYYEQMQLKKGVEYTFKVLGFNVTRDAPSQFSDELACVTTENIEVLYSQDFSVVSDTKYDPDSVANGAYSFDNTATIGSQFDKVKGYVDRDGNVVIRDNNGLTGSSGSIGSNSSFNSLMMQSSSFLSLCKNVFTYFPDWVKILLSGGLIAIILVAIWRKI